MVGIGVPSPTKIPIQEMIAMRDFKIGEASWDEQEVQGRPKASRKKIPFLTMKNDTSYRIRIVSKPYRYFYKWVKNAAGKNLKLNSSLTEDCPLLVDGAKPDTGWYTVILYREGDKTVGAVLDFGRQIRKAIEQIQSNADYGKDVSKYDLTITKGVPGSQPLYTVIAAPPKELSEADKVLVRALTSPELDGKANPDFIDLEERCKPLSVEVLRKILAGEVAEGTEAATASAVASEPEVEAEVFGAPQAEPVVPPPAAPVVVKPAPVVAKPVPVATKVAVAGKPKTSSDFLNF